MRKKGYALLVVIIVISGALMLGFTMLRSEAIQTKNLKYEKKDLQSYYAAESGINDLVDELFSNIKTIADSHPEDSDVTVKEFIQQVNAMNMPSSSQAKVLNKFLENDKDTLYNANIDNSYNGLPDSTELDENNRLYFIYPITSTGESNLKDSIKHTLKRNVTIAITIISSGDSGDGTIDGIEKEGYLLLSDAIKKISDYQKNSSPLNENRVIEALYKLSPYWGKIKKSDIIKNIFNANHISKDNCGKRDNWSKFVRDVDKVYGKDKVNGKFSSVHHLDIIDGEILKLVGNDGDNTTTISIGSPVITK